MARNDKSTNPNERALIKKHQPVPTVTINTPAMAGPTARATLTITELSVTALAS